MPVAPMEANDDAANVTGGKIGIFPVEQASLISHFELRQNSASIDIFELDGFICEPCRNRRQ
jgi:hypothetical protein